MCRVAPRELRLWPHSLADSEQRSARICDILIVESLPARRLPPLGLYIWLRVNGNEEQHKRLENRAGRAG